MFLDDPSGSTLAIIIVISFCFSILCSLIKSAHVHLSSSKIKTISKTKKIQNRLNFYFSNYRKVLLTFIMLSGLSNITFVVAIMLFFSNKGSIRNIHIVYGLILAFIPLLIFAKAIPEIIAKLRAETIMNKLWLFSKVAYWLLLWLVFPVYHLTLFFEKVLKITPIYNLALIEEQILDVINEGEEKGVLHKTERDMITGIMEFNNSDVSEIMTPRIDMFSIPLSMPVNEALELAIQNGHSRIPVYKDNRDDIVGILYVKDLLPYWKSDDQKKLHIEKLIREPYFIPETKHIGNLLHEFQQKKIHIAVIIDEYGGTAGIVTIEDIIEEIVGEILDEHDASLNQIKYLEDNIVEVDSRLRLEELNKALQISIPLDNQYETVGGFLFTSIGYIPLKGETYRYNNLEFIVVSASTKRIERIKVIKLKE